MKRYAFPLTIILLLSAVIALAAPGDKRPAVTSAAIGLGTSSSPTLASITATTSVTAPAFNSSAADGYHYVLPYNSIAFAGTPSVGMFQTTPTGPKWYTGSAWEAIGSGGASAIADLTDWPSGLTATELGYLDGATSNIQAQVNAISVGSPVTTAPTYSDQSCTAGQYAFDASYAYFCRTSNTWDRIALGGWSNPSPVAPTFSSFTINSAGTGLTASLSASTTVGAGGSGGLTLTCSTAGTVAATYGSGSPGTSYVYTLGSTVYSGDTCTAAYTQPGNGLEGTTGGADVVSMSGSSVTNGSTATQSVAYTTYFANNFGCADSGTVYTCASTDAWSAETDANSVGSISGGSFVIAVSAASQFASVNKTPMTAHNDTQLRFDMTLASAAVDTKTYTVAGVRSGSNQFLLDVLNYNKWQLRYYDGSNALQTINWSYTFTAGHTYTVKLQTKTSATTSSADGSYYLYVTDNGGAETLVGSATGINTYNSTVNRIDIGLITVSGTFTNTFTFDNVTMGYK